MPGALVAVDKQPAERNLSWGEVDWLIEVAVAKMMQRRYHPTRIIPIGGGGIIPAAIMAYRFYKKENRPIELMAPIYARSYTPDHLQHELQVLWPEEVELYDASNTLFVDDIVDTGATWRAVTAKMPQSHFYAMVTKIDGHPDWYSTRDVNSYWWNFPWEKVASEPKEIPDSVQG